MLEFLFWAMIGLILYTYIGYPVVIWIYAMIFKKPVKKIYHNPKVSIVISAFNEEKNVHRRLENLMALDYPKEQIEILIGSDGAFDRTDEIVSGFSAEHVRFFRFVKNSGKPHILNSLVKEAHGSILIFADMRQDFDTKAIKELVANFADPEVGCVSGELHFYKEGVSKAGVSKGMGQYWSYEKFLRKCESQCGSMLGATGAIYAIRRKLFSGIPTNILVDDMFIPFSIMEQGYRAIFESEAKAYDFPSEQGEQEFKRKVRTLVGNYQIFGLFPEFLNPFRNSVSWQFISHKFMRVIIPFFLILLFIFNLILALEPFYLGFLTLQILFYMIAGFEMFQSRKKRKGIGYIPYTFCLLNYSALVAFYRYMKGEYQVTWEKAYE